MQPTMLNEVIKGKRPVTANSDMLFEEALDVPADFRMQFQSQYEQNNYAVKSTIYKRLR